jgi:hypothetical protein
MILNFIMKRIFRRFIFAKFNEVLTHLSLMKGRLWHNINENLIGILATIIFHLILVMVFLVFKIASVRNLMDTIITIDFEETELQELPIEPVKEKDIEFDQYVADYFASERSNIPVNVAARLDEQISTDRFVDELTEEMNLNRSDEMIRSEERLRELQEMESDDNIIAETNTSDEKEPIVFKGKTNIYYSLENRYHIRLPVPVYKCEGFGIVEVQIFVDQKGFVVNAQVPNLGESMNEICLAEAAKTAAMATKFNSNFDAPLRQQGTITYHFQSQ